MHKITWFAAVITMTDVPTKIATGFDARPMTAPETAPTGSPINNCFPETMFFLSRHKKCD